MLFLPHHPLLYFKFIVEVLNEMSKKGIEPSAAHYNLVLRTLKSAGYAEKMYRMLIGLSAKEGSRSV